MSGFVYLLHFDRPISDKHTAQHYIGWAYRLDSRMRQHIKGRGARFTQVANERGINFVIAASWPGDRHYERTLKNKKHASRMCPICRKAHDPKQRIETEDLL
jgi:predicted GIY-YIG superfamily endonuclease